MRTVFRRSATAMLIVVLAAGFAAAQTAPADLDEYVSRAMKTFDVPGLALAIVKDGRVAVAKGYGVRKLGDPAAVDAHTLFGIASNTKAFTAAALGMLVDEGKIAWDDPVIRHLPAFRINDPWVSRELTIRDLLSHRTGLGLGAGDLLYWPDTDFTREQVLAAAAGLRPASSLRSRYAYNNLGFVVAGQIIPAVTGKSWDDFVRERIFQPLGMTETQITSTHFKTGDNVAVPHSQGWRLNGTLAPIAMTRDDTWAAAAGIKSNISDLAKWVQAQLNEGKAASGQMLWRPATSNDMWSPQTVIRVSEPAAALKAIKPHFAAYGLGWSLKDYRGRKIVSHGGALTGMVSTVVMIPEERLGIVVLTNQEESGAYSSIVYHILDHYFGLPATDWTAAYSSAREESMRRAADQEKKQAEARAANTHPSLDLAKYAGEYKDAWYGNAEIRVENGKLVLRMAHTPSMVADLEHWHYDTFVARFRDNTVPDAFVTFALARDGTIDQMTMSPVSSLADFSFDYDDLLFKPAPKDKKKS